MNFLKAFVRDNWKKLLGIAVGATGVFYPPLLPVTTTLGGLIIGTDFQVGAEVGTAVGKGAQKVINHDELSAEDLQRLADAKRLLELKLASAKTLPRATVE